MKDKQIVAWQRLEGLLILVVAVVLFGRAGGNWWWFALLLLPDISMLGYLLNPRIGAFCYNVGHSLVFPLFLVLLAILTDYRGILLAALVWLAHIGLDRALGYGLKLNEGFKHTHLGKIGK